MLVWFFLQLQSLYLARVVLVHLTPHTNIIVFMAVTSAMSGELVSVSTIVSYDIYRGYINPHANGKMIIRVAHMAVVAFTILMSCFSTGLNYAGFSMGYLYDLTGIITAGAVIPATCTILWKQQNKYACGLTPIIATAVAIMSWLVSAHCMYGTISIDTAFADNPVLIGNLVALLSPLIFIPILTYGFKLQNYDWSQFKTITVVSEDGGVSTVTEDEENEEEGTGKKDAISVVTALSRRPEALEKVRREQAILDRDTKRAGWICITLTVILWVVWPMPMYGTGYLFSKRFFCGWVAVSFIWLFFAGYCTIFLPLIEGRHVLYTTFRGIYWELTGQGQKLKDWQDSNLMDLEVIKSRVSVEAQRAYDEEQVPNVDSKLETV